MDHSSAPVRHGVVTIAVVEDDKRLSDAITDKLEAENYIVVRASDGQKALNTLEKTDVDMIILDMMLPVMDGISVLEMIRGIEHLKEKPVLVLTNLDVPDLRQACFKYPPVEYAVKVHTSMPKLLDQVRTMTHQ